MNSCEQDFQQKENNALWEIGRGGYLRKPFIIKVVMFLCVGDSHNRRGLKGG